MSATTEKISDKVTTRVGAARKLVDAKVVPIAVPAGRRAAKQVRHVVEERIVPAVDSALVASAPARTEAVRRGRLAAAALRGADSVIIKKRRRWPIAMFFLALGSAVGAGAAWLSQAGKPVQLAPYPLAGDEDRRRQTTDTPAAEQTGDSKKENSF
jgi:hypothetical protein